MHVSSLFGDYSIGSFGKEARYFVDFLAESGFGYWQVLPFGMPDEYNSPYKSSASLGACPFFIDLPTLYREGLISDAELASARQETAYLAEYDRLWRERIELLSRAAGRVEDKSTVIEYVKARRELYEAAEFLALKDKNGGESWQSLKCFEISDEELFPWQFIQYEFFRQWSELRSYANSRGIRIIGDLPIYVSADSADVYYNRSDFLVDCEGYPTLLAGAPPDCFSEDGQLWGNPLYDYGKMKKNSYRLWRRRLRSLFNNFDGVRIDHFRGIESFWAIEAGAKSARQGRFLKGPGRELIDVIREEAGDRLVIAEDLGEITSEVRELLEYSTFPGMRVIQFAFLGDERSCHLPHNYIQNTVAYSGTHDNNTLLGFLYEQTWECRRRIFDYCGYGGDDIDVGVGYVLRTLTASAAGLVIFPIQDLLCYGKDTRMNLPGVAEGNWRYRITKEQLDSLDRTKIRSLIKMYGR